MLHDFVIIDGIQFSVDTGGGVILETDDDLAFIQEINTPIPVAFINSEDKGAAPRTRIVWIEILDIKQAMGRTEAFLEYFDFGSGSKIS